VKYALFTLIVLYIIVTYIDIRFTSFERNGNNPVTAMGKGLFFILISAHKVAVYPYIYPLQLFSRFSGCPL